ncbi:MAG: sugar phosphate isomerase/epimerase [Chloroflexi bacterium]|nr:sugar phosphate isomerase/epimerase [Chloroflexota bacterium]
MSKQTYEVKNDQIRNTFETLKQEQPGRLERRLTLSWSNWGFGIEPLATSVKRLADAGVTYIELHGNHYGPGLGYDVSETRSILEDHGMQVSGVCGMYSPDNDLSSNRGIQRQAALDYIKRELDFTQEMGGGYLLVVPAAVGRPNAYDDTEFARSVDTLRRAGDWFVEAGVKGAVEPIRSAEVSLVHTVSDAQRYIEALNHPGVQHINGDVYHMQSEEAHIGEALMQAGQQLINLHMADSNRRALGEGAMDLDTIIMALYIIGFNAPGCFVTPEPLGPGGDPYPAMHGRPVPAELDHMVQMSVRTLREREAALIEG